MELSLFSLKVFLRVVETRSFSEAAASLFLTQPAVSLQIQKLEGIFRTELIVRKGPGEFNTTEAGSMLVKHAEEFMRLEKQLLFDMEKFSLVPLTHINIGACCIAGEQLLPLGLQAYKEKSPHIKILLHVTKCDDIFRGLAAGTFDLACTGKAPTSKALAKKKLLKVPLVFFEAKRKSRSYPYSISLHELKRTPLILREEGAGCRAELMKILSRNGIKIKDLTIQAVSESNDAILRLVKSGEGVSILPEFMIQRDIEKGLLGKITLKETSLFQEFYLVFRKRGGLSRSQAEFVDFVVDHLESTNPAAEPSEYLGAVD
jgi:DNA-binding transcriptional LysR family regulator